MKDGMTITEGLKKLTLLQKRMERNSDDITKYSSLLSNEKPYFDTEQKQREEVQKLIQANLDLELEYCRIKAAVDYTNLRTFVNIEGDERTIHDWLTVLRKTGNILIRTYKSLSTNEARNRQMRFPSRGDKEASPVVVRLYDENEKRNGQRRWEDLTSGKIIESRLEVVNATTQLIVPSE
jgi:hypothetical protein